MLYCLNCNNDMNEYGDFNYCGEEVKCSECQSKYYVKWEEIYDSDSGEEWSYFSLEWI